MMMDTIRPKGCILAIIDMLLLMMVVVIVISISYTIGFLNIGLQNLNECNVYLFLQSKGL